MFEFLGPLLQAGTSLLGGLFGGSAASKASKAQQEANTNAAKTVNDQTGIANAKISDTAAGAGNAALARSESGATKVDEAARNAAQLGLQTSVDQSGNIINTANTASGKIDQAAIDANAKLDPFAKTGTDANAQLDAFIKGQGSKNFTVDDFHKLDPSYQFNLEQQQQALERGAASRGGVQGGGFAKALSRYVSGYADDKFGAAFDRFRSGTTDIYNRLKGVSDTGFKAAGDQGANLTDAAFRGGTLQTGAARDAGTLAQRGAEFAGDTTLKGAEFGANLTQRGQEFKSNTDVNAADQVAANLLKAAQYTGDTLINSGNAKAAGILGKTAAYTGAANGVANAFGSAVQNKQTNKWLDLLKGPKGTYTYSGGDNYGGG